MRTKRAVIIGAGVAGLSAAWWLHRAGWSCVVLERANDLRSGGYMMGLSGPGLEVAGQMGLMEQLESKSRLIDENVYRDRKGRELMRLKYREFLDDLPFLALRRTDLVQALYEGVKDDTEIRFGCAVSSVSPGPDEASVTLSDGETLTGDLVIGADGLRSFVRREVFGPDEKFFVPLGYRFAAYDLDDTLHLGMDFVSYAEPGRMTEYYTLEAGRLAALHIWKSDETGLVPLDKKWDLVEAIAKTSHETVSSMTRVARDANEALLLDDLTMVSMPKWSAGRVLLMGDSAHCLTLISGQGAGMALTSAAILGNELKKHSLDEALLHHEARLRPSIKRLQGRSVKMAKVFIPATPMAFGIRNFILRNMPRRWLGRYFVNAIKSEILQSAGSPVVVSGSKNLASGI